MENLIKDVIELDRKARKEVELLEAEKSKISEFVNEKKSEIEERYKAEAKKQVQETKERLQRELDEKKADALSDFNLKFAKLEETIQKNKKSWIDSIYNYCVEE